MEFITIFLEEGFKTTAEYVDNSEYLGAVVSMLIKIATIIIVAKIVGKILSKSVRKFFAIKAAAPLPTRMSEQREKTLVSMLENGITYALKIIVFLCVLAVLGVDTAAIALSAGFVGLAAGLGAQTVIKDVIIGFLIVFEDQFSVGDRIRVNANILLEGEVLVIGVRTTKILTDDGDEVIVTNGSIMQVSKMNKENNDSSLATKNYGNRGRMNKVKRAIVRRKRRA